MMNQTVIRDNWMSKAFLAGLACLFGAVLLASALSVDTAYAEQKNPKAEGDPTGAGIALGNDYVWAGDDAIVSGGKVDNDILAAGRMICVNGATVGGSIRAAGQHISVEDCAVTENVTIAGESLSMDGGSANAVCMAGRTASYASESSELYMYAQEAVIDGVVHGNVVVAASEVKIGPNAVIEGTLSITTSMEPTVSSSAKIGEMTVQIDEELTSSEQVAGAFAAFSGTLFVFGLVISIVGALIIAVLAEWLFKRHTAAAAEMIRTRTGATIGSGIIGALVAPIVILVLCCLLITLPVAGALALALIAMTIVAEGFAGASLFKLAFPNLGRFKTALAGGAIVGVASAIPFLGSLVSAAAFMYFLGYVLQTVFLTISGSNGSPAMASPMPPASSASGFDKFA